MKNTDKVLRGLFVSILGVACFVYFIGMPLYLSKLEEAMELGAASENAAVISWLNHLRENGKDLTGPIEFQVCNAMDKFTEEKEKYKSHLFYGVLVIATSDLIHQSQAFREQNSIESSEECISYIKSTYRIR